MGERRPELLPTIRRDFWQAR